MKKRIKYNFYIYKITNILDGKIYIGKTTDPKRRWYHHQYYDSEFVLKRALEKHSIENFNFEVIEQINCTNSQASKREVFFIKHFNCKVPLGYNMTNGGEGSKGFKMKEETVEKIRKARTGKKSSLLTRIKQSEIHKKLWQEKKSNQINCFLFGNNVESY
jgi:group I intron endonuclease